MSRIGVVCRSFAVSLCYAQTRGVTFFSAAILLWGILAVSSPSYAGNVAPYFTKNEFNGDPRDNCSGTTNPIDIRSLCSGQVFLATALWAFQYRRSASFGANPPL